MSKLQEKRNELITLRGEWAHLFKSKPDHDFDESEITILQNKNEAMATLAKEVETLDGLEKAAAANEAEQERLTKGTGIPHQLANGASGGSKMTQPPLFKAVQTMMEEDAGYKALTTDGSGTAQLILPREQFFNPAEYKTLVTLATVVPSIQREAGIYPMARETRRVVDLFAQGNTTSSVVEYYEQTGFTNAAAAVAEGGTKPESALAFTLRSDTARKLAHWIPVTRETLQDVPQMASIIEDELRFGLEREIEDQIINGDGTAPNISGILDRSGVQTTAAAAADDVLDALLTAMTLIRVNAFAEPDGIIMHPNDYAAMATLRTTDGIYLLGNPQADPNIRAWGLPIRITTAATENTAIVGAFRSMARILYREPITVTSSSEHSTYFIENKVAILAETRLMLQVRRPAAFATVTGV